MRQAASWLQLDPDARIVRWGWILWLAWSVIGGVLFLTDVKNGTGALSFVLVAPFWALWLLWPVVRAARSWWQWQYGDALSEWNGVYYEFDGRQIRILMQGDAIWIVASDVFDALDLLGRQRDTARVREIAGREGLVRPPGARRLAFSEIGVKAWLDRRSDPRAHKFSYWLDKQVIAPYRKRQEMAGRGGAEG